MLGESGKNFIQTGKQARFAKFMLFIAARALSVPRIVKEKQ